MDLENTAFDGCFYKKLFQSINEGIVFGRAIYNESGQLSDYCHLEVNPAFECILGINSAKVQGKTWREVQYFGSLWIEQFSEIGQAGSSLLKDYYDTKLHQWFHVKAFNLGLGIIVILFGGIQDDIILAKSLQEQTKECHSTYLQTIGEYDTTADQSRQEAERRAKELDTAISAIAAGVIIFDKSGKIIRMNQFANQLMGGNDGSVNCDHLFYNVDGSSYKLEETLLYRALKGEFIRDQEIYVKESPGKIRWQSATLSPIFDGGRQLSGVIMIMTDITERKRKEENLLAFERELLKVTLNSLDEGVVTIDAEKCIIFVNKAASDFVGYPSGEAIGKPLSKIFYFLDDTTSEPVDITINPHLYQQLVLVSRDLHEVTVTVNRTPIKNDEDQIIGTVLVIEDITEKQKIDQEMLKTAKLESLAVLAGGVAHDFNNILAGILANLQLASTKLKRHEDILKNLETTAGITRKASELTKQLLTFAKGGNPVRRSLSIIDLIRDTVQFILSGSKVKAEFYLPEDLWVVDVDEGQIAQVINNITINAKQAMPIGGVLQIIGENVTLDATDQHIPGQYIKLTLMDHGIGIPEGIIDKIFDPFFTTKKTGNGLGLSTSYSIIKKHNGYLEVESTPGIGTIFYIFLPASTEQREVKKAKSEIVIGDHLKILLMDDEESIRNVSGEMLTYFGYQVKLARDGQEAIKIYKEAKVTGEPFDVVIMDLTIPGGLGGMETMAVLRQIDPEIKAIITSGYTNDQVMAEYRKYGFSGVVTKPYQINELNEVIMKVIDQKQLPLGLMY